MLHFSMNNSNKVSRKLLLQWFLGSCGALFLHLKPSFLFVFQSQQ